MDVAKIDMQNKKQKLKENILKLVEKDNESFLRRLRDRINRVGIEIPKIEVRYEDLSVEGDIHVGSRALPTLLNATLNTIEGVLGMVQIAPSKKRKLQILKDVSGIIRPSRMTLLLGPPSAGKTTLLKALAGKLDQNLRVSGKVTYCGHEFNEFVPQRTCAYISQHDLHFGEMTVRETLDFSGRFLGVGSRYEILEQLSKREKEAGIEPDIEIDTFMKATAVSGQETSLITDYILKILGLEICADTIVGDVMRRGISGGQKKRVTIGEMLVGPAKVFAMDEISTGLDSTTTYQICNYMRQMVHISDLTMVISLLQPAPETYELFDDIILLSEGQVVYQGPRENVLEFFEYMGFKCPDRKGVADFLQEVTSKKDQEQYWFKTEQPYIFISVSEFSNSFKSFHIGQQLLNDLKVPYDKSKVPKTALTTNKYGISNWELFKACFSREWLLMKHNYFIYAFKIAQITIMSIIALTVFFRTEMPVGTLQDGEKFLGTLYFSLLNVMFNGLVEMALTVMRLPVFYKQRDFLFYPAWAFALPILVLRIPLSFVESAVWIILTYYTIGYAPDASRFFKQFLVLFAIHHTALSLFRFVASIGRTQIVSNTLGIFTFLILVLLGGIIIDKNDLEHWISWGYYISIITYGLNAIVINEFLDDRWSVPNQDPKISELTVGKAILKARGIPAEENEFWVCIGALFGFSLLFNILVIAALTYLNPIGDSKAVVPNEESEKREMESFHRENGSSKDVSSNKDEEKRGMVLPFQPLSIAFNHINYFVDMPIEMKSKKYEGDRLQLLRDVSGAFRPGILTAIVGVSGAGKTTLMDVLAGRKTGGYIEGTISISGYPKNQSTFARISGYCEQNDIHSPNVTVYESLLYSAWLRLSSNVNTESRKMFVDEIMELVELNPIRDALVGLPNINGLSTEQRKRLTIAVELVANPSIIFMDEPTSGLDARAAAIVMRTVRNTVDTGRTVVCTIHQPSIDIFEAFDELLLMKLGGHVIYAGPLGSHSHKLIEFFEAIPKIPKIKDGYNPATWMLEITDPYFEAQINVDFAEIYAKSSLYQRNQELINELSTPTPGSDDLHFPTKYSQPFLVQCKACFWKQHWSYWRNPEYNAIRFFSTTIIGAIFGIVFWNKGQQMTKQQDVMNILGGMFLVVLFLGGNNANAVQPIVSIERTVSYRERAAGMYSAVPYAFAQVAIETIYTVIQSFVFSIILFSVLRFEWTAGKFMWLYYYITMCFTYFTMCGMMVTALTPGIEVAAIVMSFILSFWNLFAGFFLTRVQIPIWWRWYYWASPVAWTVYGLVTSQLGDKDIEIEVYGFSTGIQLKMFLKESLGFDYDFLPVVGIVHLAWVLLFFFVFAYGIKYLNFQKR
ncbi:hypothetical protein CsatB_016592 [Cannabis sativa]